MDFVVAGFGLGALCILIGLAIRDWGPRLRRVSPPPSDAPPDRDPAIAWIDGCRAAGIVLSLAGGVLWLVTFVPFVARASDAAGGLILLLTVATVGIAGVVVGGPFVWRQAHPSDPIGFLELARRIRADAQARRLAARAARLEALARQVEVSLRAEPATTADDSAADTPAPADAPPPPPPHEAEPSVPTEAAPPTPAPAPAQEEEETAAGAEESEPTLADQPPPTDEAAPASELPSAADAPPVAAEEPAPEATESEDSAAQTDESETNSDRTPSVAASTPSSRTP